MPLIASPSNVIAQWSHNLAANMLKNLRRKYTSDVLHHLVEDNTLRNNSTQTLSATPAQLIVGWRSYVATLGEGTIKRSSSSTCFSFPPLKKNVTCAYFSVSTINIKYQSQSGDCKLLVIARTCMTKELKHRPLTTRLELPIPKNDVIVVRAASAIFPYLHNETVWVFGEKSTLIEYSRYWLVDTEEETTMPHYIGSCRQYTAKTKAINTVQR